MAKDGNKGNPQRDDPEKRLWGGRFAEPTDAFVARFTASVDVDKRLYHHDIRGSIAHANGLRAAGVLDADERRAIVEGLEAIEAEIERGEFAWDPALEDVHMNIEARLTELVGEAGKKLHTARSRNDQVATDVRLWLRDAIGDIDLGLVQLMRGIVGLASQHTETVMPGLTHLQTAQPVTFAHHLMAWFEMARRDRGRFQDCLARANVSPLGSAALAGTTFPIDRAASAGELGFDAPAANSLDAVSDRDFAVEFCAAASLTAVHLSRWCEEVVLWMSPQWGFVTLPDAYCTGSSIMPQKKNPDVTELVRGKTGRVIGNLNALLVLMKGQPLAYNRDNQEDKLPLFDTADTLIDCLDAMTRVVDALEPNPAAMRAAASKGFAVATDFADYLVRRDVPFRDAHEIVGKAVALAVERDVGLDEIPLGDLQALCPAVGEDVYGVLTLDGAVAARDHVGGTAPKAVASAIEAARRYL
ncbi:MAG: argininosuccinate lyase [Pseudomonadales bacterium]|nr:argininosuccinate lyase [Pseudomonadales bacterium]